MYPSLVALTVQIVAVSRLCIPKNAMSVKNLGNYWLQDSNTTVPRTVITHIQNIFRWANFACYYTLLFTKQTAFSSTCFIGVLGHWLKTLGPMVRSKILQHNYALFYYAASASLWKRESCTANYTKLWLMIDYWSCFSRRVRCMKCLPQGLSMEFVYFYLGPHISHSELDC